MLCTVFWTLVLKALKQSRLTSITAVASIWRNTNTLFGRFHCFTNTLFSKKASTGSIPYKTVLTSFDTSGCIICIASKVNAVYMSPGSDLGGSFTLCRNDRTDGSEGLKTIRRAFNISFRLTCHSLPPPFHSGYQW